MAGSDWSDDVLVLRPRRTELPENPDICKAPAVCFVIPRGVGVNPYLVVEVNGRAVTVSTGTDLRGLLRQLRLTAEQVLPTLAITRQWGGKPVPMEFDRTMQDVLGLIFTGRKITLVAAAGLLHRLPVWERFRRGLLLQPADPSVPSSRRTRRVRLRRASDSR